MSDNEAWTTIESDPGVFTELIREMGVRGVQVEELYSLDSRSFETLKPVYGLIFLFKWQQQHTSSSAPEPSTAAQGDIFFAQQLIPNACATQALLAILLNRRELELGKELTDLRNFTSEFPPDLKGHAISNSESIRKAHNSFRPPNPFVFEDQADPGHSEDVYHFIAYVPIEGSLYELDGLKAGPKCLCTCTEGNWLELVQPFIQQRMEMYNVNEIGFNLMAVIRDRKETYREQLQKHCNATDSPESTRTQNAAITQELQERLKAEEDKAARWRSDNIKRRHNYTPFIFNLVRILAEEKKLQPLIEKARVPKRQD